MTSKELESRRPTFFFFGLMIALSSVLMAFEWTSVKTNYDTNESLDWDDIDPEPVLAAITIERLPEPSTEPATSAPQVEKRSIAPRIVRDAMPSLDKLKTIADRDLSPKTLSRDLSPSREAKLGDDGPPRSVRGLRPHELPYLRECGHITDDIERFQCTQLALKRHVTSHFKIPSLREVKDLPSRIAVTFTIDRYGEVTDVQAAEKHPMRLKQEVERVMSSLPEMVPATAGGQRIPVRFELPILLERKE